MYTRKSLLNYIFFDAETKPKYSSIEDMPENLRKIWLEKHHFKALEKEIDQRKKQVILKNIKGKDYCSDFKNICSIDPITVDELYIKESGLLPEFAEIYCISFGVFNPTDYNPIIQTFCADDEKETLESFLKVLHHFDDKYLFGYNTNEFDIPFILKRMWINGICDNYPPQLQLKDTKPWTVKNQDHMLNYKAGSWSNVSLDLLCEVFGVPTPKDEFSNSEFTTLLMSGSIGKSHAIKYCEKDVKALMEVVLKVSSTKSNFDAQEDKFWKTKTTAKV